MYLHEANSSFSIAIDVCATEDAVNTAPQTNLFRGAKVCSKWLQERTDDHNIQSDNNYKSGLKVRIQ